MRERPLREIQVEGWHNRVVRSMRPGIIMPDPIHLPPLSRKRRVWYGFLAVVLGDTFPSFYLRVWIVFLVTYFALVACLGAE